MKGPVPGSMSTHTHWADGAGRKDKSGPLNVIECEYVFHLGLFMIFRLKRISTPEP